MRLALAMGGLAVALLPSTLLAGSPRDPIPFSSTVLDPTSTFTTLSAVDLDGDGDQDLVAGSSAGLVFWENLLGDGSAWLPAVLSAGPVAGDSDFGDVNGDGCLDILVAGEYAAILLLAAPTSPTGWIESSPFAGWLGGFGGSSFQVELADVDRDGDLDALVSIASYPVLLLAENLDGLGTFPATPAAFTQVLPYYEGLESADLDGDGDLELLGDVGSTVLVHENVAQGGSWPFADSHSGVGDAHPADIDGDGDLDLVFQSTSSQGALMNDGAGTFSTSTSVGLASAGSALAIGDLDADGDLDLVSTANPTSGGTLWSELEDATSPDDLTGSWFIDGAGAYAHLAVADLDGDGDLDVAAAGDLLSDPGLHWFANLTPRPRSSAWYPGETTPPLSATVRSVAPFRRGPHHRGEAVLGTDSGLWAVSHPGTFPAAALTMPLTTTPLVTTGNWASLTTADLDGDGDLDIVGADDASGTIVRLDEGPPGVWTPTSLASGLSAAELTTCDLDRDGDLDLLGADPASGQLWLLRTSTGPTAPEVLATRAGLGSVACADGDDDGDPDVLYAAAGEDRVGWLLNAGDGVTFTDLLVATVPGAASARAADADADGDLDVFAASPTSTVLATSAAPALSWTASTIGAGGTRVAPHDLDRNGTMDVVVTGPTGATVHLGSGTGWSATTTAAGPAAASALVDLDRDGDLDLLAPGPGNLDWFVNHRALLDVVASDATPPSAAPGTEIPLVRFDITSLAAPGDPALQPGNFFFDNETSTGSPAAPSATFSALRFYRDDGDGLFDPAQDELLAEPGVGGALSSTGGLVWSSQSGLSPGATGVWWFSGVLLPTLTPPIDHVVAPRLGLFNPGDPVLTDLPGEQFYGTTGSSVPVVVPLGLPPVPLLAPLPATIPEGTALLLDATGTTDPDDPVLPAPTWSCPGATPSSGVGWTVTCSWPDEGSWTVEVVVTDPGGLQASATATVQVTNVAPSITTAPTPTAAEGQPWIYAPAADEPGADTLTWSVSPSAPASLALDPSTGALSWTPTTGETSAAFTLFVEDGDGGGDAQGIALSVTPADTDGDGLPDAWEAATGLDPSVDDSAGDPDGDGLTNAEELAAGTDPFVSDAPSAPILLDPLDGEVVGSARPLLSWNNASDPQGDLLLYEVEVYADAALTTLLDLVVEPAQTTTTSSRPSQPLPENQEAFWRVRAWDAASAGPWSAVRAFTVDAVPEAPSAPVPWAPLDGDAVDSLQPTLSWSEAVDPDGDPLTYEVTLLDGSGPVEETLGLAATTWTPSSELTEGSTYSWTVLARDPEGLASATPAPSTFTVDASNQAPPAPVWVSPQDADAVLEVAPLLVVSPVVDPEEEPVSYRFELSPEPTFAAPEAALRTEPTLDLEAAGLTLDENGPAWLRVRAEDARGGASDWSPIAVFVRGPDDPPEAPRLLEPDPAAELAEFPTFVVEHSEDPERDPVLYGIVLRDLSGRPVATVSPLAPGAGPQGAADRTSWRPAALQPGTYTWTASATDGLESATSESRTFVYRPPSEPEASQPETSGCASEGPQSSWLLALLLPVGLLKARRRPRPRRPA